MVVFRFLGLILIVAALMLLGADIVTTAEKGMDVWGGDWAFRSLDQVLVAFGADIKPWIETTLPEPVSGWLTMALSWPSWADLGVPGVLLSFLGGSGE